MGVRSSTPADALIGNRLRQRRLEMHVSQTELGAQLGISFQQMQKYEIGENRISAARLFRLSQLLDVPVTWFFGGMKPEGGGT